MRLETFIYKIFVASLIVDCYICAPKIFSKYEQKCFIKYQTARDKNARQCNTALLEACGRDSLYIVPWFGGRMHFTEGGKMFIKM